MAQAWARWAPVVVATAAALPVALLVTAALAGVRRRRGRAVRGAWRDSAAEVGMVAGTAPWLWMILTPAGGAGGLELVPGPGLVEILTGPPGTAVVQVGGNLLVFAAFGLLAPLRWPVGAWTVAGCAAAASAAVELLQYTLDIGRVTSVDDVLLNTLGAVLAAALSRRWWRRRAPSGAGRPVRTG